CIVVSEGGGFLQQVSSLLEIAAILGAVGNDRQFALRIATDHSEKSFRLLALRLRQRFYPTFELLFAHVGGIEVRPGQLLWGDSGQKGGVSIEVRPRALIDPEVMKALAAQQRRVFLELCQLGVIARPELRKEDVVDNPTGLDQLRQRLLVAAG